jgi:hypothetical protein
VIDGDSEGTMVMQSRKERQGSVRTLRREEWPIGGSAVTTFPIRKKLVMPDSVPKQRKIRAARNLPIYTRIARPAPIAQ